MAQVKPRETLFFIFFCFPKENMPGRYNPYGNSRGQQNGNWQNRNFGTRPQHFNDVSFTFQENPVWTADKLFEFKLNFYVEHPDTAQLTEKEVQEFREKNQMTLTGKNIPRPVLKFSQTSWPEEIRNLFEKKGFSNPTPIQSQGWPMALTGRNVVGIAQTGSGKTLSFILPAIVHILGQEPVNRGDGPRALVLAPTRELAMQIEEVAKEFGNVCGIRNACLYGGASKGPQIGALNRSPHIVVATPGRLLDMLQMGKTTLNNITYLVLDEADRMLDMGFEQDLRRILAQIRPDRQMLMWSATWPKSVKKLANDFLTDNHIKVQIGSQQLQANKRIKQIVQVLEERDKPQAICKLLIDIWNNIPEPEATRKMERTIVFSNKKYVCEDIAKMLWHEEWACVTIHGDKTQQEREQALNDFKSGRSPILIATDVAARGLDVKDVMHVINYDFPNAIEDFVHRIGRTARGSGVNGSAYTFFTTQKQDRNNAGALVELMKGADQEVPKELENLAFSSRKPDNNRKWNGRGSHGNYGSRGGRGGGMSNYRRSNW
jgi:superfamily II DNA/RNA helicase